MTPLFNYMSWNIEKFSLKGATKSIFRDIEVRSWIASLIVNMDAHVIGVMEVTLATGESACELLRQSLSIISSGDNWLVQVSDRNVATSSSVAARADKYAVFYNKRVVGADKFTLADNFGISFTDRAPLFWQTHDANGSTVNCILWHAPQPKNHQRAATIKLLADLATAAYNHTGNVMTLISGDFNYNTDSAKVYNPLTSLGFSGIFNGERTTLTSLKNFMRDADNRRKMVADGNYDEAFLANCYDNVFLKGINGTNYVKVCVPYVILNEINNSFNFQMVTRMQTQEAMKNAKIISDHMPLVITITT